MASEIIGSVVVSVVPDGTEFPSKLQKILDGATETASKAGDRIADSLDVVGKRADAVGERVSSSIGGSLTKAAGAATAMFAAFKGGEAVLNRVLGKISAIGDATALSSLGFKSLLGEDAGAALLKQVQDFGAASSYSIDTITRVSQGLVGAGVAATQIIPTLKNVADVVASVGGNFDTATFAIQQMATAGKASGQDLFQLTNAGIPIWKLLAEQQGKTVAQMKKLSEQGKITFEDIRKAMETAASAPGVAGLASKYNTIQQALDGISESMRVNIQRTSGFNTIYAKTMEILNLWSNRLGSPQFLAAMEKVSVSVGEIFTRLAEAGDALGVSAWNVFLTVLTAIAPILEKVADAINAIPLPVLEALMALMTIRSISKVAGFGAEIGKLATQFKNLAKEATSAGGGIKSALKSFGAGDSAIAAGDNGGRFAGLQSLAGAGSIIGGSLLTGDDPTNTGRTVGGMALTGAGIGMAAGPWGAAAGAAIGAAVGFWQASEAKARKHKEEMEAIADETVTAYLGKYGDLFNRGLGGDIQQQFDAIAASQIEASTKLMDIATKRAALEKRQGALGSIAQDTTGRYSYDKVQGAADEISSIGKELKALDDAQLIATKTANDLGAKWQEMLTPLEEKLRDSTGELTRLGEALTAGLDPTAPTYWADVAAKARDYGLTLEQIVGMTNDDLAKQVDIISKLAPAFAAARSAADAYNVAAATGKETANTIFGANINAAQGQLAALNAQTSSRQAAAAAARDQNSEEAKLNATIAANQAAAAVYADTMGSLVAQGMNQTTAASFALNASMQQLEYSQQIAALGAKGHVDQLIALSGVADTLENRQLAINIGVAGYETAMAKLQAVQAQVAAMNGGKGPGDLASAAAAGRRIKEAQDAVDKAALDTFDAAATLKGVAAFGAGLDAAKASGGGGGGGAAEENPFDDKLKNAADELTRSFEEATKIAEEMTKAFQQSIKERTKYDSATSISRLIKNANRQTSDINSINSYINDVTARGLSQAALDSIIGSVGLEDTKQLKKLSRASAADLQALSKAVEGRDNTAAKVAQERAKTDQIDTVAKGILEAAKILGIDASALDLKGLASQVTINGQDADSASKAALELLLKTGGSTIKR